MKDWGGSQFEKDRSGVSGIFLFYPVWKVHELIAAKTFLGSNLTEKDIVDRHEKVGGYQGTFFWKNRKFRIFYRVKHQQ